MIQSITLVITRKKLVPGWEAALSSLPEQPSMAKLFFLDEGAYLTNKAVPEMACWETIVCSHSLTQLDLPNPDSDLIRLGGLANLGLMLRESTMAISLPHVHVPARATPEGQKKIAIQGFGQPCGPQMTESLRVATGLAGCNHTVDLFPGDWDGPWPEDSAFAPGAVEFLEAMRFFKVNFHPEKAPDPEEFDLILQV